MSLEVTEHLSDLRRAGKESREKLRWNLFSFAQVLKVGDQEDAMSVFECAFEGFRSVQICFNDFVSEIAMLTWVAAYLERVL